MATDVITPPAAVLFDLDGTLADTAPDIAGAVDHMLTAAGRPAAGLDKVRGWIGGGVERLVQQALHDALQRAPQADQIRASVRVFLDHYARNLVDQSRCYPGMEPLLQALSAAGVALGCVTNKPQAEAVAVLEGLNIAGLFRCIVGGDTTSEKKPAPAPVLRALEVLDVAPCAALLVGDSDNDLLAAARAGVAAIWVTWGYQSAPGMVACDYSVAASAAALRQRLLIPPRAALP